MEGKAFIFSAPSGSGKTTIVRHLLDNNDKLAFSVSATNRPPRMNEVDGKDYHFLSEEQFRELIKEDGLLEHEEVYPGRFYGTLRAEVERLWSEGKHVVFDVDVVGGINLKQKLGKKALSVFVKVPSLEQLESRLTSRGTEHPEELANRVSKAREELTFEPQFDVALINDKLDDTLQEAERLIAGFLDQ